MTRTAAASPAVYREHPIKILRYSAKNLWLLIFPLLRSLRFYPFSFQNLIDWGAGVWFDLLVALLILGIGTLRWHACIYYFDEVTIRSRSGILLQRVTEIPLERIASTVEEHPFYLRPLRAACLRISTAAGAMPDADMQLTLYLRDLHRLRQNIPVLQNGKSEEAAYHTPAWRTMLFSALFSSSFSGALYIATLFFQGGRITSDLLEQFQAQQLLEDATDRASTAFHGVPRIAVTIGIIILALWLISFGRNLLRYGRFKMRFGSEFISVHTGIITRRRYHLRDTAIIFPDLRQNLVMKIFGMVSLHIRCPGYGSRRDTLPVLIPLMRKKSSQPLLERLHAVPVMEHPKLHAKSNIKFFWSFVWPPVIGLCAIFPVRFFLLWLLPGVGAIIRFFSVMMIIPLVWLLCIRIVAMVSESVTMDDQHLQMHFCSWFTFHTITVNHARIVRTDIMQTPMQKQYGVCHLYITCNGPRQQRFKLTALPEKKVREILAMLEEMIPRVETSFVLDRLDYMKKGGRCSTATALGASLLKLHPCLDVVDGKLPVTKKYRGSIEKVVEEYVRDRLRDRTDLDTRRAFLVDTCPDDHLASIAREVLRQDGRFQEIIEAKAGCTIFCHCGPGTLGVIFLRKA